MKPFVSNIVLILLSAGVGALATCLLTGDRVPDAPSAAVVRPAPKTAARVSEVPGAVERALRKRVRQLEGELASVRAAASQTNAPAQPEVRAVERPDSSRQLSWRERGRLFEEFLKTRDPKGYEEMLKRREEMQKHRMQGRMSQLERTKGRLDFFGSVDTSGMSDGEKANHEKLQDLLVQREELPEFSEKMTEDEMLENGRQRMELDRAIREASAAERAALLKQKMTALGFEGNAAVELSDELQEIIRATESDRGPRGGPPGPPPQTAGGNG